MDWKGLFTILEANIIGVWVRESPSLLAFPAVISLHAIGMGFLVGGSVALDLRMLGFASGVPLSSMERFFPVMRFGFWINAISGLGLLLAYPTKALTNPVFYLKLLLIGIALIGTRFFRNTILRNRQMEDRPLPARYRMLAVSSLVVWAAAVTAGRLLAYTYTYLDASAMGE